jgi:uncharacterized protein (AIM24 family)
MASDQEKSRPGGRHEARGRPPPIDPERAKALIGKYVLIGITYQDHKGNVQRRDQFHGDILRINDAEGIVIRFRGSGYEWRMPPALEALQKADPGRYTLKSTGEVVVDPDLVAAWTVTAPDPKVKADSNGSV